MATPISPSEQTTTFKSRRVLACVLCQQRKIKCDRTFPCANCIRAGEQCEQAIRQRRRRFPERDLLARLRHYESLLRQHNIKFDPLHTATRDRRRSPSEGERDELPDVVRSENTLPVRDCRPVKENKAAKSKSLNLWHAMSQKTPDPKDDDENDDEDDENDNGFLGDNDDLRHAVIKKAWNHTFQGKSNDHHHHLLFGSPAANVDNLSASHPTQVSIRPDTDPTSLSSMLSVAIRIGQRIGIHNESTYGKCSALEAEMRRRLWWSLIIFDNRICEMADYKTTSLASTWDCRIPLNVSDFELQLEIKTPPAPNDRPTEMLFAVVASELGDFVRHSVFHLDLTNPFLTAIAPGSTAIDEMERAITLEKTIEEKYLASCNPENPLHFMTIWTMRGYMAKNRLLQHYSQYSTISTQQTDTQRNVGISYALRMLECDTNLMTSPLTKGYLWLVHFHFPFPAYVHLLQELKKRPVEEHADRVWEVMSNNYEVRMMDAKEDDRPFFIIFSRIVFQAWKAREEVARQQGTPLVAPRIVSDIRNKLMQMMSNFGHDADTAQPSGAPAVNADNPSMPMDMEFNIPMMNYGDGRQMPTSLRPWGYPEMAGPGSMDVDANQFILNTMEWNALHAQRRGYSS
ncbi:hypothetical protein E8E15_010633 [Penicillium rubens]|nr:hypothetical protein E8E15_010633 [Penicillium rubens]